MIEITITNQDLVQLDDVPEGNFFLIHDGGDLYQRVYFDDEDFLSVNIDESLAEDEDDHLVPVMELASGLVSTCGNTLLVIDLGAATIVDAGDTP